MSVPFGYGEKTLTFLTCVLLVQKIFGFCGTLIFTSLALSVQIYLLSQNNLKWKRAGVAGPKPVLLLGNLRECFKKGFHNMYVEWKKKYGKVYGIYFFTQPDLVVCDVEVLKQILVKDFHNFTNRRDFGIVNSESDGVAAKVLSLLKDDEWKNVRSTLSPAFTGGKLKNMEHLVDKCVSTLSKILSTKAKLREDINVKDIFSACTMEIIAACAFGTAIDCQENPDDLFLKYANQANTISLSSFDMMVLLLFPWTVFQMKKRFGISLVRSRIEEFFQQSLTKIIEQRKKSPLVEKPDLLQLMINACQNVQTEAPTDEEGHTIVGGRRVPLTDQQIISQCFVFLLAGYETTAVTLTNVAYLLALNEDAQDSCLEEAAALAKNGKVSLNDCQHNTPYLEAVISEALRLFPPALVFDRTCKEDYVLDGMIIPKNAAVSAAAYAIHHDEQYYPNPELFQPDRFLPEEKAKRNPLTYIPFGYGPRNCIGQRFAQMTMKLILANILLDFKFGTCAKTEAYPPVLHTTNLLKPKNPIFLKVEKR